VPSPPRIRDVAAAAGVSVGTVSNVLNRPDLVAPETTVRVQEVIRQLGFVRNESARQLRVGRSRTLGLVVLDITNPFFTDVARGVEDAASDAGLAVILCNTDDRREKEDRYLQLLAEQRVQGILIVPVDDEARRVRHLRRQGIPVVLLDHRSAVRNQCSVSVDDLAGGRLAASHLLEQGHTRIAFVCDHLGLAQVADRHTGAQKAIADSGVRGELMLIEGASLNVAGGRYAGTRLAEMSPRRRPTAVICVNDLLAIGLQQECIARHLSIPHDIAIVGYDDIDFAASAAVPLTSLRQPRHELGYMAAQLLLEESSDMAAHRHRHVVFAPELVVRESTVATG
jgi:LacI family transcriptional regulator